MKGPFNNCIVIPVAQHHSSQVISSKRDYFDCVAISSLGTLKRTPAYLEDVNNAYFGVLPKRSVIARCARVATGASGSKERFLAYTEKSKIVNLQ